MIAALGAVACADSPDVSAPPLRAASVSSGVLGMVEGRVTANGTVTFRPLRGVSAQATPGLHTNVYGTEGGDVLLYATPTVVKTTGASTTWTFNVGIQNLLPFPIGANQAGPAPSDTLGLYVAIISEPTATSGNCIFCRITFNSSGTSVFSASKQPYVFWNDRLTAVGGGKDTTTARLPFTFTASRSVTGFRFTMMVGAAWPPPKQTVWSAYYNAAIDSEPDLHGKPPWKMTHMASIGMSGEEKWKTGALTLRGKFGQNIYLYRSDSLAAATSAVMEASLQLSREGRRQLLPEVVFGLVDDAGKLAMVGLSHNRTGFVGFGLGFLSSWTFLGTSAAADVNTPHSYKIQKFGVDSVVLLVDGVRAQGVTYASLPLRPAQLPATASSIFGAASVSSMADADWFHVTTTFGSLIPGPTPP